MAGIHDTEAEVSFNLEVRLPRDEVIVLASRMTGGDDDAVLAAEKALRRIIEAEIPGFSQLEIWPEHDLRERLNDEADTERRCQGIYGPTTKTGDLSKS